MFRKNQLLSIPRAALDWLAASSWLSFLIIFTLAFCIRYDELKGIHPRYLVPNPAWELPSIAISLMKTGQFADPYMIATGPTAHLPPIFPYIFCFIYRIFGLTSAAGFASWIFIFTISSLLYALLPWFSEQFGLSRSAGFIGGIAAALKVEWPGHGEYLTGLFLGLILVIFLKRWRKKGFPWQNSLFFGIFIGAAFHVQPALLPVILACVAFELWWFKDKRIFAHATLISLGIILAALPWAWRNYKAFDTFFFIRSNFGLELRMGNHEGAVATMEEMDALGEHRHPSTHFTEVRLLKDVGEIEYMRQAKEEAFDWLRSHPRDFLWLAVQRIANLWAGPIQRPADALSISLLTILAFVGMWRNYQMRKVPQRAALLIPLITYPVIYYFMAYMPRYRIPIDWILYLLAGAAIWHWIGQENHDRNIN
jgi:hypothetical protein